MKIQIVGPTDNWVLQKLATALWDRIPGCHKSVYSPDTNNQYDITYFLNYALYRPVKNSKFVGGYFTHKENGRFKEIADKMDFCISMSLKYVNDLTGSRQNVYVVHPGIDLEVFKPKLRIGVISNLKSSRKGKELLDKIKEISYVELKVTGGSLAENEISDFYNSVDYVLIPGRIEGGPMALIEGLACGKKIIAPDVGMVKEFDRHVYSYDRDNINSLEHVLRELYRKRLHIRKSVEHLSYEYFADEHMKIFNQVCDET